MKAEAGRRRTKAFMVMTEACAQNNAGGGRTASEQAHAELETIEAS